MAAFFKLFNNGGNNGGGAYGLIIEEYVDVIVDYAWLPYEFYSMAELIHIVNTCEDFDEDYYCMLETIRCGNNKFYNVKGE